VRMYFAHIQTLQVSASIVGRILSGGEIPWLNDLPSLHTLEILRMGQYGAQEASTSELAVCLTWLATRANRGQGADTLLFRECADAIKPAVMSRLENTTHVVKNEVWEDSHERAS
jgi:hypothetical protein